MTSYRSGCSLLIYYIKSPGNIIASGKYAAGPNSCPTVNAWCYRHVWCFDYGNMRRYTESLSSLPKSQGWCKLLYVQCTFPICRFTMLAILLRPRGSWCASQNSIYESRTRTGLSTMWMKHMDILKAE